MKFEFLGTSDTGGIPLLGCTCVVCEEAREKKKNNRSTSAYLELEDGSVILFDAGYDLLSDRFNTTHIRAVFLTHFHADHCLGLLRLRKSPNPITCYIPDDAHGFGDLFTHKDSITYTVLDPFEKVCIEGVEIVAIPLMHSKPTHGYGIFTCKARVAYLTDCGGIEAPSMAYLQEQAFEHLFIDACYTSEFISTKHLNWESAGAYIKKSGAQKGYLIHASCKTLLPLHVKKVTLPYPYIDKGFCVEM